MSKKNKRTVKYAYLRDERDPRRVMTIARRWGKNGNKMRYAYTICNPVEDQFCKVTGRDKATRRMEVNPTKIRPQQGKFVLRAIIIDIATRNAGEERERNAVVMANQWIDENDWQMEKNYNLCAEQEYNDFANDYTCNCYPVADNNTDKIEDGVDSLEEDEVLDVRGEETAEKSIGGGPLAGPRHSSKASCCSQ